ncbi:hypothetical protein EDC01DRAFT_776969 [Geopyxis carbonaria]|nr:hypothetical protein EDC01DRAFT_776969 [Geopyxis carbonaria]
MADLHEPLSAAGKPWNTARDRRFFGAFLADPTASLQDIAERINAAGGDPRETKDTLRHRSNTLRKQGALPQQHKSKPQRGKTNSGVRKAAKGNKKRKQRAAPRPVQDNDNDAELPLQPAQPAEVQDAWEQLRSLGVSEDTMAVLLGDEHNGQGYESDPELLDLPGSTPLASPGVASTVSSPLSSVPTSALSSSPGLPTPKSPIAHPAVVNSPAPSPVATVSSPAPAAQSSPVALPAVARTPTPPATPAAPTPPKTPSPAPPATPAVVERSARSMRLRSLPRLNYTDPGFHNYERRPRLDYAKVLDSRRKRDRASRHRRAEAAKARAQAANEDAEEAEDADDEAEAENQEVEEAATAQAEAEEDEEEEVDGEVGEGGEEAEGGGEEEE